MCWTPESWMDCLTRSSAPGREFSSRCWSRSVVLIVGTFRVGRKDGGGQGSARGNERGEGVAELALADRREVHRDGADVGAVAEVGDEDAAGEVVEVPLDQPGLVRQPGRAEALEPQVELVAPERRDRCERRRGGR